MELWLTEGGETKKLVFSGDVGNTGLPLIGAPLTVDEADYQTRYDPEMVLPAKMDDTEIIWKAKELMPQKLQLHIW